MFLSLQYIQETATLTFVFFQFNIWQEESIKPPTDVVMCHEKPLELDHAYVLLKNMLPPDLEQIANVIQEETESPVVSPSDVYDDGRFENREDEI